MSKTIIHLNASSLKSEYACIRRWYLTVVEGWKSGIRNNDTEYGSAFHRFMSTIKQTDNFLEALQVARKYYNNPKIYIKDSKKYLTMSHLMGTCQDYYDKYGDNKDEFQTLRHEGKALVELKFCVPYYVDDSVEILLEGTIDDLCKNKRGCYAIRDYKTTAAGEVDNYLRGYELSTQLMFYYHAVKWYAKQYTNSIFAEFAEANFACFIDGVFLRGADKPVEFIRSDMQFYTKRKINEFEQLLQTACLRIASVVKQQQRPLREGMINGYCFGHFRCPYFNVCAAADERTEQWVLENNFEQHAYEPLKIGMEE